MSDSSIGLVFNDKSKIIWQGNESTFNYKGKPKKNSKETSQFSDFSDDLTNKIQLLKKFSEYLTLKGDENKNVSKLKQS